MDPAVPELPRRSRRSKRRRARMLIATAGTALLAVTCVAAMAAARENSPRSDQRQAANLSAATTAALTDNWYESAPYYSVLDSARPTSATVMSATGQKAFDMAFILADGGGCTPAWNGTDPVSSDTQVAAVINEVRSDGGDVIVSGRRLQRDQARPGLRDRRRHRGRVPAGHQRLRAARVRLRPRGTGDRELRRDRQRARRGADPAAEQPGPVHLGHDAVHRDRRQLLRPAAARRGQDARLHPQRLHDHAVRRRLQRRLVAGRRAAGLQRAAGEHVRLEQFDGVRARGLLRHERPDRLRRVLLPERLPDRAQLRAERRPRPVHVLVGQPRP